MFDIVLDLCSLVIQIVKSRSIITVKALMLLEYAGFQRESFQKATFHTWNMFAASDILVSSRI